jgi:hypothetical protein
MHTAKKQLAKVDPGRIVKEVRVVKGKKKFNPGAFAAARKKHFGLKK